MSKLYLYSIFHGNLNYSSISPEIYDKIIDSCYWPILDLINEYKFCPALEFPLNTLEKIRETDSLFLEELQKFVKNNKCEIIASAKEQVIFPLVPQQVNEINLEVGKTETEKIFSTKIKTAYVNEQLFSSGLVPQYIQSKFQNIITVWEWASQISHVENDFKFRPMRISTKSGNINIIWNSYISYQKFQRYINGEIEIDEYFNYLLKQKTEQDSCFPFYGSDLEIFGYKNPVLGLEGHGKEIDFFKKILDQIEKRDEFEFVLPSKIIEKFPPKKEIDLNSARFAILGKKQDKFSIARWATCGRDNGKSNSLCYSILKKIRILNSIQNSSQKLEKNLLNLTDCWASDYRTHTTEIKHSHFNKISHVLNHRLDCELENEKNRIEGNDDLILYNPNEYDWLGLPFEIKLQFSPGKFKSDFDFLVDGKKIPIQLEEKQHYKDKSLRSAIVIIEPKIFKQKTISIKVEEKGSTGKKEIFHANKVETSSVKLSLMERRGGTISELIFSEIDKNSLIGFLEHGTYEDPKMSPDFYSGHTVAFDYNAVKLTDLTKTTTYVEKDGNSIRKKIFCDIDLNVGDLSKIYYVYENHPRIDVKYVFNFKSYRPTSFRTGIFTLNPIAFDKNTLMYSTHNGGNLESFSLEKEEITHDESTDPRLSSRGCLGSTENMIDFGDQMKGVTIFSDKSLWYSVPMINYRVVGNDFFYRISNSISELDDTTMTWWKGRKTISFSLLGRDENTLSENEKISKMMFLGLLCISKNPHITVVD